MHFGVCLLSQYLSFIVAKCKQGSTLFSFSGTKMHGYGVYSHIHTNAFYSESCCVSGHQNINTMSCEIYQKKNRLFSFVNILLGFQKKHYWENARTT